MMLMKMDDDVALLSFEHLQRCLNLFAPFGSLFLISWEP
jgi:hypothetical protein